MKSSQDTLSDFQIQKSSDQTTDRVAALTRSYGNHSLAFFGLAPENSHFLTSDGAGLVNYRLIGRVAVVLGDPICPPELQEQVTHAFLAFCALQRWDAVFYQTSSVHLSSSHTLQLRTFKMGEEAVLDPQSFTLRGSALANVRTSCRRAERDEVVVQWYEGVPPAEIVPQLAQVSHSWLEQKAGDQASERGFSMGKLDELIEAAERADRLAAHSLSNPGSQCSPRFLTGIARTRSDTVCAFVTFTPVYGLRPDQAVGTDDQTTAQGNGWMLDLMRRAPDAPPGVMELLLVRAIEHLRSYNACRLSLGLVALADTRQEMTSTHRRLTGFVSDRLGLLASRQTLFNFKQKFHPRWESRYIVGTTLVSPSVILAILRLRNGTDDKRIRLHVWRNTIWQFLRYCIVGGINTLADLSTLNLILWRFPTSNVQTLLLYNSIAYSSGAVSSFFFNKYWTFRRRQAVAWREVRRFVMTLILEVLYSNTLIWLASKALQPLIHNVTLWGNASKLLAIAAGAVLSYTFLRFWTFAKAPQKHREREG